MTITGCNFESNSASNNGQAIFYEANTNSIVEQLLINGTTFTNNCKSGATGDQFAISFGVGDVTVKDCTFDPESSSILYPIIFDTDEVVTNARFENVISKNTALLHIPKREHTTIKYEDFEFLNWQRIIYF